MRYCAVRLCFRATPTLTNAIRTGEAVDPESTHAAHRARPHTVTALHRQKRSNGNETRKATTR